MYCNESNTKGANRARVTSHEQQGTQRQRPKSPELILTLNASNCNVGNSHPDQNFKAALKWFFFNQSVAEGWKKKKSRLALFPPLLVFPGLKTQAHAEAYNCYGSLSLSLCLFNNWLSLSLFNNALSLSWLFLSLSLQLTFECLLPFIVCWLICPGG